MYLKKKMSVLRKSSKGKQIFIFFLNDLRMDMDG